MPQRWYPHYAPFGRPAAQRDQFGYTAGCQSGNYYYADYETYAGGLWHPQSVFSSPSDPFAYGRDFCPAAADYETYAGLRQFGSVPSAPPTIAQNPNPNYPGGAFSNTSFQAGSYKPRQPSFPTSTAGLNTSGGNEQQPVKEASSAAAMGGGRMQPGYHRIVKAFDDSHRCDENCPDSDYSDASEDTAEPEGCSKDAVAGDVEKRCETGWATRDCVRTDDPYLVHGVYSTNGAIAEVDDSVEQINNSYGFVSQDVNVEGSETATLTNAEPKPGKDSATSEGGPLYEEGSNKGLQRTASISASTSVVSEPESLIEEDASLGELGQCVVITKPTTARISFVSLTEGAGFPQKLAATTEKEASIDALLPASKDSSQTERLHDELEAEAKRQRKARDLRKNKNKCLASTAGDHGGYTKGADHALAKQLTSYEFLGYLNKVDAEEEDESLLHYGDRFGLAVLSDYPDFFMHVPQHPHYKKPSLEEVDPAMAEPLWDLFMPLMDRGIRAVRHNNVGDIASVEQVIATLEGWGFDLRHLKAYIRNARRLRADLSSAQGDLERLDAGVEKEDEKIAALISSKPLRKTIEEMKLRKATYEECLRRIEASLAEKMALVDEEESIRATRSTAVREELLKSRDVLERRVDGFLEDFESLGLLFR